MINLVVCENCDNEMIPNYNVNYKDGEVILFIEGYFCDACGAEVALADDKEMLQV